MLQRFLYPLVLGAIALSPSLSGCSSSGKDDAASSTSSISDNCISVPNSEYSVCDDEHGRFKSTYEKFGLAAIGVPLTPVWPDGKGDWYQTFERVEMNGNFGQGCEDGFACIAHLGRWDLAREGKSVGSEWTDDCNSDSFAPRENVRCMPRDFLENNYYRNGGRDFYGVMLSRVYDNCELFPNGIRGQCFWTERAKVGRIYGRDDWEGEQLGRKKLGLEGTGATPPGPDPLPTPSAYNPTAQLTPQTVYIPYNTPGVLPLPEDFDPILVSICEDGGKPEIIDQFRKWTTGELSGYPTVVLETYPGRWQTREADRPQPSFEPACPGNRSWTMHLYQSSGRFLDKLDFAGAFVQEFTGGKVSCSGGYEGQVSIDDFVLDVQDFKIQGGKLRAPKINVGLKGSVGAAMKTSCSFKKSTPPLWVQAGAVPVLYELWIEFGLTINASNASAFQATLGTDKNSFWMDNEPGGVEFGFEPEVKLGVTLYKTLSASVGLGVPVTVTPHPPCTPEIKVGVSLKAGVGVDLAGIEAEGSYPAFEKILRASQCN